MSNTLKKLSRNETTGKIRIVKMELDDLDAILAIDAVSFVTPWSRNLFIQELNNPLARNLVAKIKEPDRDDIGGYIDYWVVLDEVHLQHIATRKDLRRSGIASLLCAEMMMNALQEGAHYVTLEVRRSNIGAIKFYEKFAFEVKGVRPGYYDDTHEDALIMWVDIKRTLNRWNDAVN